MTMRCKWAERPASPLTLLGALTGFWQLLAGSLCTPSLLPLALASHLLLPVSPSSFSTRSALRTLTTQALSPGTS